MEKEFVPYELAVKLKALGFNEPCLKNWDSDLLMVCDYATHLKAPLYQQAFRWFREKCELFHSIRYQDDNSGPGGFDYEIQNKRGKQLNQGEYLEFKTYEEAELECLTKLIEIVKQQKEK